MAQIIIPTDCTEIYAVTAQSGTYRYEEAEPIACEFCDWKGYPKYFTTYEEAKMELDSITLNDGEEYPQRKSITTISLIDSDEDEEITNY